MSDNQYQLALVFLVCAWRGKRLAYVTQAGSITSGQSPILLYRIVSASSTACGSLICLQIRAYETSSCLRLQLTFKHEARDDTAAGGRELVLALDAVQVAVPDAGVAINTEEDEGVCDGLEPVGDRGFESLVRLGAMAHDNGLWVRYLKSE